MLILYFFLFFKYRLTGNIHCILLYLNNISIQSRQFKVKVFLFLITQDIPISLGYRLTGNIHCILWYMNIFRADSLNTRRLCLKAEHHSNSDRRKASIKQYLKGLMKIFSNLKSRLRLRFWVSECKMALNVGCTTYQICICDISYTSFPLLWTIRPC